MKKVFNKLFLALMLVAGLSFVSCKDDDGDDKKNNNNNNGGTTVTDPSGASTSVYFTYADCINMMTWTKDNIEKKLTQKGFSVVEEASEEIDGIVYSLKDKNGDFHGIEFDFNGNDVTFVTYVIGSKSEKIKNVYPTFVNQSYDFMKSHDFSVFSFSVSDIKGGIYYKDNNNKVYSDITEFLKNVDMAALSDIFAADWAYSDGNDRFYSDVYLENAENIKDNDMLQYGKYFVIIEIELPESDSDYPAAKKSILKRNKVALR